MKKIDAYLRRKKIFKISFLTSALICFIFTIFAASFIFQDTTKQLQQEDFVIGMVYDKNEEGNFDGTVSSKKSNESPYYIKDLNANRKDEQIVDTIVKEKEGELVTLEDIVREELCVVSFYDENGDLYMESTFGKGDTLVFPYLPYEKQYKVINDVTYTFSWGEVSSIVNEDASYHLTYVEC